MQSYCDDKRDISIHAPRKGSDMLPEFPCLALDVFQSTPPARGATSMLCSVGNFQRISIHAPRKGSDFNIVEQSAKETNFNPRPPQGERR